ncbi:transcription antitermination factor NusB [Flavobacteriaceae bacterium]|jgi:N utilization substance protein B|nr:transcription antitermination factor NusB [Flavobacteriaceae bacterium]|tara:strand:- start:4773 stop:5717 length:945 start_codon:yes stop_codon:yes gene_type:complete
MLNRRHIRIKVMQIIYSFKGTESDDLMRYDRFLLKSIDSMLDLYFVLMSLMIEVHKQAESFIDKSQQKHLATKEDKNPNRKFLNNEVLLQLKTNETLVDIIKDRSLNFWELDNEYVDLIFKTLLNSDLYKDYMSTKTSTFKEDKDFVVDFFKEIIAPNDKLYDYLEDKNITWVDDLPVVNTALVKLLRKNKLNVSNQYFIPTLLKDDEDKDFALALLKKTILNLSLYSEEIENKTQNWDKDRIANIDFVLLQMAICEFQKFPSIPVKVTINEYIEIAKEYSTPKSSIFINGVLDKIVKEYTEKRILNKVGRGLM